MIAATFGGSIVLRRTWLLVVMSCLLAVHALVIGRLLPSCFFITAFCWAWVAVAAFLDRLEAARAMAATMIVIQLLASVVLKLTPFGWGGTTALYVLALLPSLVAWACIYIYIVHLESEDDVRVDAAPSSDASEEWAGDQPAVLGRQFSTEVLEGFVLSNDVSPALGGAVARAA